MQNVFNIGPNAPYRNTPIHIETYVPKSFAISNITLGRTTKVITSVPTQYVVGQLVRLLIPAFFGTRELTNQLAYVINVTSNEITLNIDSSAMTPYKTNPTYSKTPPQVIAVGDANYNTTNSTAPIVNFNSLTIPGAFRRKIDV